MNWLRNPRVQASLAATLLFALLVFFFGPQKCVSANYQGAHPIGFAEHPSFFFHIHLWCGGRLLREYAEVLTAIATVVLTGSTIGLWTVTKESADAGVEQAKIAQREFVSTNRPKLKIRLLRIKQPKVGEPIFLSFEVVNIGATRATIVSIEATVEVLGVLNRGRDSAKGTWNVSFAQHLAGGEALLAERATGLVPEDAWGNMSDSRWVNGVVRIIGTITYADDNGVIRRTGFYRECTEDVNRFRYPDFPKATLEDYEYQD